MSHLKDVLRAMADAGERAKTLLAQPPSQIRQEQAAQEAVTTMRGMGMNEHEQGQALNAAVKLAAVGAMNHPDAIDVFCKIVASGRVTMADLFMLNKYGIEITQ